MVRQDALLVFFFKQKTAYEIVSRDWSSDVCSSDLVMNRHDLNLPEASSKSFWLNGSLWQYPDFENVDTFANRLVRDGLLIYDPLVGATLQGRSTEVSLRTVQRRFL